MCGIFIGRLPEDVASPDAKTREAEEYLPYGENGGGRGKRAKGKEEKGADRRAEGRVGKLDVQFLRHYKSIHLRFNQVGERRARASYRKRVIYLQELTFTTWCL